MNEVYVVVDRDYKVKILGIFSSYAEANEHALDHNGEVFCRHVYDKADKEKGYLK